MSAGCELSSGLVSIELPARLHSDDRIELGDKVVTHDRHVESAGHRVAVVRPKLPRQVRQSTGLALVKTSHCICDCNAVALASNAS
jgi:hypothetical protein